MDYIYSQKHISITDTIIRLYYKILSYFIVKHVYIVDVDLGFIEELKYYQNDGFDKFILTNKQMKNLSGKLSSICYKSEIMGSYCIFFWGGSIRCAKTYDEAKKIYENYQKTLTIKSIID